MIDDKIFLSKFSTKKCAHNKFVVDESLATVHCGLCDEKLNPIWIIKQFSNQENRYVMRLERLDKLAKKAAKKNYCKCRHCGLMTPIQIDK